MEFFTHITFFATAQGLFLSCVILLLKRGNRLANGLLACLVLLYSLWMAEFASYFTRYLYEVPHLMFVTVGLPLLFGPLLLFYVQTLEGQRKAISRKDLWHVVPFVIHTLYYIPFFLQSGATKRLGLEQLQNVDTPPAFSESFFVNEGIKFLHLLIYLGLVYRSYRPFGKEGQGPVLAPLKNRWLKQLLLALGLFLLFDFSHFLSIYLFHYDYLFGMAKAVLLSGTFAIYYLGYSTIRQPEITTGTLEEEKPKKSYQKSSLKPTQAQQYIDQLLDKMEKECSYLQEDLKLNSLAAELGISTHHLSQVLNEHLGKSFSDFINAYRIKHAQTLLADPAHNQHTILSIAFDSGFSNKASFNAAFKKHSGQTPSAFRKAHQVV
ncbi:MAG: helix-turn-helix domain-containing protein [Saprospiraceae bacterium]|nr:helix-turn-helix domain-containing protein [Saprospiraceae bacterium]